MRDPKLAHILVSGKGVYFYSRAGGVFRTKGTIAIYIGTVPHCCSNVVQMLGHLRKDWSIIMVRLSVTKL